MARSAAAALLTVVPLLVSGTAVAQPRRPEPLPQGNRIVAQHGDTIVLEDDAQVRIVRRREANVRVVFNRTERWVILLADFVKGGPDGRVDWSYTYRELSGGWPMVERWEGPTTIEEYGLAGPASSVRGLAFTGPAGMIQIFSGPPDSSEFRDANAAAILTSRSGGAGTGGGDTFEAAESREIANLRRSSHGGMQFQTVPGGGTVGLGVTAIGVTATEAAEGASPVRVGGSVRAPQKIVDVAPVLPDIAATARVRGVVIVEVTIGPDGAVSNAKILRSIPLLDAAALEAVRQWRYTPVLLNGKPVPVVMTVAVPFN